MKRLLLITTCLFAFAAYAEPATMQSPAYAECTRLSSKAPEQALAKADAWLKFDTGIAAQHCRAMALYGLRRYAEAGDSLVAIRNDVPPSNTSLRSYLVRQASRAYQYANHADQSLALLSGQLAELDTSRGDNASTAKLTSEVLLDRARLNITYGKLKEASLDLDRAVSLTPINEEVLLERAGVFEKLGDVPLAKADVNSVLTINANNAAAKKARTRLNGEPLIEPQTVAVPSAVVAPAAYDANAAPVMPVAASAQMVPAQATAQSPLVEPSPVAQRKTTRKKPMKKKTAAPALGTAPLDSPTVDANAPSLPVPAPTATPESIKGQPKLPLSPGVTPSATKSVNPVDLRAP